MKASNTKASVTAIIPRYAPLSDKAMIFYPSTRGQGQIDCLVDGKRLRVGIDVYMATEKLTDADSKKIALEYAKQQNIDPALLVVRQRLPKQLKGKEQPQHNRRTNDANLKLVDSDKNGEKQALAKAAQDMQDAHDREKKQVAQKEDDKRSTPENPEGAVVQSRTKRAYRKKSDKEVNARQAAALRRFQQDVAAAASKSATLMEPASVSAPKEVVDQAVLELATALARILKGNPGVL